jgi:transcriptional regulator with XRE-family HTH domain
MPSFRISITASKRAAARFVSGVRRKILLALEDEGKKRGLKQTDIARTIGVHRSVINRELRGRKDITLGRVAEIASAMGRVAILDFPEIGVQSMANLLSTSTSPSNWRLLDALEAPGITEDDEVHFTAANSNFAPVPRVLAL